MAENSNIEWTNHTFNPWRGCTKISPGCANCYAETMSHRNPSVLGVWGPKGKRVVAAESAWREPLKWDRKAKEAGERHRVFCASLADVFEDWQGPIHDSRAFALFTTDTIRQSYHKEYESTRINETWRPLTMQDVRLRLFSLIDQTPNLDWLQLTKRPENIQQMMPPSSSSLVAWPDDGPVAIRPNLWLGVSVENQEQADRRIPILLQTPAAVRFLSCEPLLGEVNVAQWLYSDHDKASMDNQYLSPLPGTSAAQNWLSKIGWVIVGGESGHGARPMHPDWARSLRDQCQAAGVPFFMKQMTKKGPIPDDLFIREFPNAIQESRS